MEHNAYISSILEDILEYLKNNGHPSSTLYDVLQLDFKQSLKAYLEWNGIIGYDKYIIALIEYSLGEIDELEGTTYEVR